MTGEASRVASGVDPLAATPLTWTCARFDALSVHDLYDALALRNAVFIVEQACVFPDADHCDQPAWHLFGRTVDGTLAAYLRGIDPGVKYPEPSLGRVAVSPDHRGLGLGRVLMEEGIRRGRDAWPRLDIVIGAQQRLEAFYASLGFEVEGDLYIEDGIDHVCMRLPAP